MQTSSFSLAEQLKSRICNDLILEVQPAATVLIHGSAAIQDGDMFKAFTQ